MSNTKASELLALQKEVAELKRQLRMKSKGTASSSKTMASQKGVSSNRAESSTAQQKVSTSRAMASQKGIGSNRAESSTAQQKKLGLMNGSTEVLQRSPAANNSTEVQQRSPANNTGIIKPPGHVNIATHLDISNTDFNGYKSDIRDFVEVYTFKGVPWVKQDKRRILKIIEKFKEKNPKFPETSGDWAIKTLIRRSINNKRAHQKRIQKKSRKLRNKSDDSEYDADDNNDINKDDNDDISDKDDSDDIDDISDGINKDEEDSRKEKKKDKDTSKEVETDEMTSGILVDFRRPDNDDVSGGVNKDNNNDVSDSNVNDDNEAELIDIDLSDQGPHKLLIEKSIFDSINAEGSKSVAKNKKGKQSNRGNTLGIRPKNVKPDRKKKN